MTKVIRTPDTIRTLLDGIDNLLLDCDGVLWAGSDPIPGAIECVKAMIAAGKKVVFITNNSTKSRRESDFLTRGYAAKFSSFGLDVSPDQIVTSGSALAALLAVQHPSVTAAYVVGEGGLAEELELAGIRCVSEAVGAGPEMLESEFRALSADPAVGAVAVGWCRAFSFRQLATASYYLQAVPGCVFLGTNPDDADRVGVHLMPGTGPLIRAVECASRQPATVVGKPNPELIRAILDTHRMDPARTLMVGDRLDTDIAFGNGGGIATCLVLTGVATAADA
ncbi:unnamed protein product, partial [Phaeothamnion confervicola]